MERKHMIKTAFLVCLGFFMGCTLSAVLFELSMERSMLNAFFLSTGVVTFCALWYPRHKAMEAALTEAKATKGGAR